ncbi:hypothetical protein ES703_71096 [subsurface metagenome]
MNAKTAIKILRHTDQKDITPASQDFRTAVKIGMEGLQRLEEARAWSPLFGKPLLPSETEY